MLYGIHKLEGRTPMLNLISLLIGLVAIVPLFFALIPFLGWANWLLLPLPVAGLIIGSLSSGNTGRNLNLVVLAVAIVRLWLGAGIF
jgi:hypothetical protein